jgi:hypothetical protein
MPVNTKLACEQWDRYAFARDNGHAEFVKKYDTCDAFFRGDQWDPQDKALLTAHRRPALTINKIISTIGNVMGEQIYNRSEINFRPRNGSSAQTAEVLTKVFKQISDSNMLDWKRSDMFADGIIGSRGYLDIRLDFTDSMQGEVRYTGLNPKNVVIDPDGEEYDPDSWNEVFTTKWMTVDDIAVLYDKEDAAILKTYGASEFAYGYDSIDRVRDRFGDSNTPSYSGVYDHKEVTRNIRVVERQFRKMDNQKHFVDPRTGDMRPVPDGWDRERIGAVMKTFGLQVVPKMVRRIRWRVTADNVVLHDDWSPYKHFTVVPYFPYFRHGRTIGLVENLVGPQELLNKVSSQELHVVNTTANSGWKIKTGGLVNMSIEELEQKGAQSGLVLELNDLDAAEKITPNNTPQGLDRISYKAEEHIKGISGVSDSMQGMDRADVAAKAIQAKRQAGSTNLVKPLDSLVRTDYIIARNTLDLIQTHYTEERLLNVTGSRPGDVTEELMINQMTPEGTIVNDLTVGEFDVIISSVPQRETLEDSQFDQAVSLRELGVGLPDSVLIENSRLHNKAEILKQMSGDQDSPEAQAMQELAMRKEVAEVEKIEAEVMAKRAEAGLKGAKGQTEGIKAEKEAMTPIEGQDGAQAAERVKAEAEIDQGYQKLQLERELAAEKLKLQREEMMAKQALAAQAQAEKAVQDRITRIQQQKNQPQGA